MNTIEERLVDAARDVQNAVATLPERSTDAPRRVWFVAAMAMGLAVVVLVGFAVIGPVGRGGERDNSQVEAAASGSGSADVETSPRTTSNGEDISANDREDVPASVLDYWALNGTLESIADEDGWLCPARISEGYAAEALDLEMPSELNVEIPDLEPIEILNRNEGPICHQPPLLVMLAPAGDDPEQELGGAEAGLVVWPDSTRFEDLCPADMCEFGGPVEELRINDQPARLHLFPGSQFELWWVDESGTPLYAESSGLVREQLLELVESIQVDPVNRRASLEPNKLGELNLVLDQASLGAWDDGYRRVALYEIEDVEISIETRRDAGFDPRLGFASAVDFSSLVEVNDTLAEWIPEGGNHLSYANADGVVISIVGAASAEEATGIAEQLRVGAD